VTAYVYDGIGRSCIWCCPKQRDALVQVLYCRISFQRGWTTVLDAIGILPEGGTVSAAFSLWHGAAGVSNGIKFSRESRLLGGSLPPQLQRTICRGHKNRLSQPRLQGFKRLRAGLELRRV
jgi:hypothetical protein